MAFSESLTNAIFRVTVPLARLSSVTSTRVPAFSPSAEATPEEVVAAAGGVAAGAADSGTRAEEVVAVGGVAAADDVVSGAGATVSEAVGSFFAHETITRTDSSRTRYRVMSSSWPRQFTSAAATRQR